MSGRIHHGIRSLCNRHHWFTTCCIKSTIPKKCLVARTAVLKLDTEILGCTRSMRTSSSSALVKRLFNERKPMLITFSIATGLGLGVLASAPRRTKANMSGLPTDPTTIESGWLPQTEELYAKLLARVDAGELRLLRSTKEPFNRVVYTLSHPQKGAHFEYALFFEEATQKGISLIQFGPQTQGPEGFVHGGATAAMFDTVTAVFINHSNGLNKRALTANLNINYRRPIPLNSTVIAETWVENIERRKHLLRCEIKSTEGHTFIEGTALWIEVKKS